jgi:hypothetical protein
VINLRYHLVSIIAVFLALGIGITMGSTFLGRETLDRINSNVDNARAERNAARAENAELRRTVDQLERRSTKLTTEGVRRLFAGDLADVPVLVVAAPGVDRESLDAMTEALTDSAATYLGTLTIDEKVRLEGGAIDDMATALHATTRVPRQLRDLATAQLARDMRTASRQSASGDGPPLSTLPEPNQNSVIGALIDAGFLSYESPDGSTDPAALLTGHGYRYVVVTGPTPDVADASFLLPLVKGLAADRPAQVVVTAAATGDEAEKVRVTTLQPYVEDDVISERISTVDDLEAFAGIAAVVLSVEDLGLDRRGHYGYADGRALLPTDSG